MRPLVRSCTKEQDSFDRPVFWLLPFLLVGAGGGWVTSPEGTKRQLGVSQGCTVSRRLVSRSGSGCHHPAVREVVHRFISRAELSCPDSRLGNQAVPLCHMESLDHRY